MNHEKNGGRRRRDWNYAYGVPALLSRFLVDAVRIDRTADVLEYAHRLKSEAIMLLLVHEILCLVPLATHPVYT
jgi:hypothetical protein